MIIIDLFDIDFHIFTVIKFLFNLVVRFKYKDLNIYIYLNDNHRSIRNRLSHFHPDIKILFNLWVKI